MMTAAWLLVAFLLGAAAGMDAVLRLQERCRAGTPGLQ